MGVFLYFFMGLQHPPIVSAMRYFLEVTNMKQNDFQKVANQVSFVTIVVNILFGVYEAVSRRVRTFECDDQ